VARAQNRGVVAGAEADGAGAEAGGAGAEADGAGVEAGGAGAETAVTVEEPALGEKRRHCASERAQRGFVCRVCSLGSRSIRFPWFVRTNDAARALMGVAGPTAEQLALRGFTDTRTWLTESVARVSVVRFLATRLLNTLVLRHAGAVAACQLAHVVKAGVYSLTGGRPAPHWRGRYDDLLYELIEELPAHRAVTALAERDSEFRWFCTRSNLASPMQFVVNSLVAETRENIARAVPRMERALLKQALADVARGDVAPLLRDVGVLS